MDWRKHGAVSYVKYQGDCQGCWAFVAASALEAQYFLKKGKLISISAQHLIDCTVENNGCDRGGIVEAYDFIKKNGTHRESLYPIIGKTQQCQLIGNIGEFTLVTSLHKTN